MIFKHARRTFSISDKNENNEYVVAKIKVTQKGTKEVEAAKIVTGKSKKHVMQQVKSKPFNYFKDLPIN